MVKHKQPSGAQQSAPNNKVSTITNAELPELIDNVDSNISLSRIIELRNKKLTYQEIADLLGCSKQNIHQRLQPFITSVDNLKSIKDNRADTLTVISDTLLTSLTEEDIKKTSAYQKVGMYGILFDKERLERGQSSANISIADYTEELAEVRKQRARLEAELGMDHQPPPADDNDSGN